MSFQIRNLSLLTLIALASTAPAPVPDPQYLSSYSAPGGGGIPCNTVTKYKDLGNSDPKDDPAGWKLTGARPVVSNSAPATMSDIKSVAYGVTITEGMSLGIDLPESVLSASFDFSFAWSKTDTQGTSSGISCPAGDYTCGMSSLAHFIDVTGTAYKDYDTTVPQCTKSGDLGNDTPFAFQAPYMIGEDGDGQNPDVTFSACICSTSKNQKEIPGLGPCPSNC